MISKGTTCSDNTSQISYFTWQAGNTSDRDPPKLPLAVFMQSQWAWVTDSSGSPCPSGQCCSAKDTGKHSYRSVLSNISQNTYCQTVLYWKQLLAIYSTLWRREIVHRVGNRGQENRNLTDTLFSTHNSMMNYRMHTVVFLGYCLGPTTSIQVGM